MKKIIGNGGRGGGGGANKGIIRRSKVDSNKFSNQHVAARSIIHLTKHLLLLLQPKNTQLAERERILAAHGSLQYGYKEHKMKSILIKKTNIKMKTLLLL